MFTEVWYSFPPYFMILFTSSGLLVVCDLANLNNLPVFVTQNASLDPQFAANKMLL